MANGLASGNVILGMGAGSYYDQYTDSLPGYEFFSVKGYAAITAAIGNRFPIWVPSEEKGRPRKRMQIPFGAQVYHVGARAGKGVYSEAPQELVLTTITAGAPVLARGINVEAISASGTLPGNEWEIFRANGNGDSVTRNVLLRSARTSPDTWAANEWDAFNQPIAYTENDGTVIDGPAPIELELQTRVGTTGTAANGALSATSPATGGLRANADYPNENYILVHVCYYRQTAKAPTLDDFAGVVWDEVLANV